MRTVNQCQSVSNYPHELQHIVVPSPVTSNCVGTRGTSSLSSSESCTQHIYAHTSMSTNVLVTREAAQEKKTPCNATLLTHPHPSQATQTKAGAYHEVVPLLVLLAQVLLRRHRVLVALGHVHSGVARSLLLCCSLTCEMREFMAHSGKSVRTPMESGIVPLSESDPFHFVLVGKEEADLPI